MTLNRLRQLGWLSLLIGCTALFVVLWVQVNSVKSDVRMAESDIIRLKKETQGLELEVQTRANQSQLAAWNAVDFGYRPPAAQQFLQGEQALAAFGVPRAEGAPDPIRVAQSDGGARDPDFPSMASQAAKPGGDEETSAGAAAPRVPKSAIRVRIGERQSVGIPMRASQP